MSDNTSEVIGQGTYGCVHSPPLLCKESSEKDLKNVSKLLTSSEASKEMKEYVLINNIDQNKDYYLGQPTQCKVSTKKSNKRAIRDCNISEDVFDQYDNYSLLIMKNGGLNLSQYAKKMGKENVNSDNKKKIEDFWLETHSLMMGLKLLHDNEVVHHDMKAGNIVYLEKENRLNFIDFGLMTKKSNLIKDNEANDNWLAIPHWSFPLELQYLTKSDFEKMSRQSQNDKSMIIMTMIENVMKKNTTSKNALAIQTFFSYVNTKSGLFRLKQLPEFIKDFELTLKDINNKSKYQSFMNHSINTIDSYGVASGLMVVLCEVYKFMDMEFVYELADILYKMFTPYQKVRLDINTVLPLYEACLEKHILKGKKLQFKDHKVVKETKVETVFNKAIDSIKLKDIVITSKKKLSKMATSPQCPEGKEYNPFTRRCIKKCKSGYQRDKNFKCIRKTLKKKDCPEGKILNPKTNRCVNKKKTSRKRCPEGKQLNPRTNRCVKIKN